MNPIVNSVFAGVKFAASEVFASNVFELGMFESGVSELDVFEFGAFDDPVSVFAGEFVTDGALFSVPVEQAVSKDNAKTRISNRDSSFFFFIFTSKIIAKFILKHITPQE